MKILPDEMSYEKESSKVFRRNKRRRINDKEEKLNKHAANFYCIILKRVRMEVVAMRAFAKLNRSFNFLLSFTLIMSFHEKLISLGTRVRLGFN